MRPLLHFLIAGSVSLAVAAQAQAQTAAPGDPQQAGAPLRLTPRAALPALPAAQPAPAAPVQQPTPTPAPIPQPQQQRPPGPTPLQPLPSPAASGMPARPDPAAQAVQDAKQMLLQSMGVGLGAQPQQRSNLPGIPGAAASPGLPLGAASPLTPGLATPGGMTPDRYIPGSGRPTVSAVPRPTPGPTVPQRQTPPPIPQAAPTPAPPPIPTGPTPGAPPQAPAADYKHVGPENPTTAANPRRRPPNFPEIRHTRLQPKLPMARPQGGSFAPAQPPQPRVRAVEIPPPPP